MSNEITGKPIDRVDGRLKITGGAQYAAEFPMKDLAYGVAITATIAKGHIATIDTGRAEKLPGVFGVLSYKNSMSLHFPQGNDPGSGKYAEKDLLPLQSDRIFYFAQGEPLDEMLHSIRARTGRHVAVLLDQFEDYVRCHAGTDISDTFDAELAHAVACREGQFVIAIQEHAIPAFERMRQHIPNLLGFQINLAPLTEDAAREAVRRAARARDLEMEEGTLDAIVRSRAVARTPGMAHPFFLMTAATQLFDAAERVKSKLIGAAVLEQYGGPDRVVFESLDSKIAELGTSHTELLFRWCNILISPDKRRLAVTEKGLADYAGRLNRFVLSLLPMVTEANILRSFETPEAIRYEIARESLTPILRDWWERREAVLVARRRAIFRTTSVSLAVGAIVAVYIVWLLLSKK